MDAQLNVYGIGKEKAPKHISLSGLFIKCCISNEILTCYAFTESNSSQAQNWSSFWK